MLSLATTIALAIGFGTAAFACAGAAAPTSATTVGGSATNASASSASHDGADTNGSATAQASASDSNADAPTQEAKRAVVVISIDGLRHDYLSRAERAPVLAALGKDSARARTLTSVWPSMTYPAHTTLVTGVRPNKHGIFNNVVFDPFEKNDHGWYWYASDIRVPTLWDAAKRANIDVGAIYWPVTVGADIKYNVPQIWRAKTDEDDKLVAALSTQGLLAKDKPPPAEHRTDRERADAAIAMIREKSPRLVFVYLTDLDTVQHENGPFSPNALKTLRTIDGYVDEIMTAARAAYPKLALALVSDHGFSEVTKEVRPNAVLRQKKLLGASSGKVKSYDAVTWKAGGTAMIMPRDPKDEKTARAVRELFTTLAKDPSNGIARVIEAREIESRGGISGAILALEARRGYVFSESPDHPLVAPTSYRGHHGYSPEEPEMKSTFFLWGDGVSPGDLGDVEMIDVAPTIGALLDVPLPTAEGKPLARALR
jgi:predicted AlkP superfamily pyrophosphatase or phosphodiesterase